MLSNFQYQDPNLADSKKLITLAEQCYNESNIEKRSSIEDEIDNIVWSIFKVPQLSMFTD